MKNLRIKKRISDYFNRNKWQILIVFASLFAGIIIGSFFSARMSSEKYSAIEKYIKNFISAYGLQSLNNYDIFKFSAYNNIKMALFLWLSGIWVGFLPIGIAQIGLKGYKIGFSLTIFVRILGLKGIILALISALPQVFIILPCIVIYTVFNINFALSTRNIRSLHISKNRLYVKNFLYFIGIVILLILSGLVDAYIVPPILKPVCAFLSR